MSLFLQTIPNTTFGFKKQFLFSSLSTRNPLNSTICSQLSKNNALHLATNAPLNKNNLNINNNKNNLLQQRFLTTAMAEAKNLLVSNYKKSYSTKERMLV